MTSIYLVREKCDQITLRLAHRNDVKHTSHVWLDYFISRANSKKKKLSFFDQMAIDAKNVNN